MQSIGAEHGHSPIQTLDRILAHAIHRTVRDFEQVAGERRIARKNTGELVLGAVLVVHRAQQLRQHHRTTHHVLRIGGESVEKLVGVLGDDAYFLLRRQLLRGLAEGQRIHGVEGLLVEGLLVAQTLWVEQPRSHRHSGGAVAGTATATRATGADSGGAAAGCAPAREKPRMNSHTHTAPAMAAMTRSNPMTMP